eukprot:1188626-Prorocentrum_minimum.AAC.2
MDVTDVAAIGATDSEEAPVAPVEAEPLPGSEDAITDLSEEPLDLGSDMEYSADAIISSGHPSDEEKSEETDGDDAPRRKPDYANSAHAREAALLRIASSVQGVQGVRFVKRGKRVPLVKRPAKNPAGRRPAAETTPAREKAVAHEVQIQGSRRTCGSQFF